MIDWNQEDLKYPDYDLCVYKNNIYIDIVRNNVNLTWSFIFDNKMIAYNLSSRKDAMNFAENWMAEKQE